MPRDSSSRGSVSWDFLSRDSIPVISYPVVQCHVTPYALVLSYVTPNPFYFKTIFLANSGYPMVTYK